MKFLAGISIAFLLFFFAGESSGAWSILLLPFLPMITIQQIKKGDPKTTSSERKKKADENMQSSDISEIVILPNNDSDSNGKSKEASAYFIPLINLQSRHFSRGLVLLKRIMDCFLSSIIIILVSPILLVIALIIKLDSPGAVFYKQNRVGENGNIFRLLKFRSMIDNAEGTTGPVWAKQNDTRITRTGRILRTTHLDELPQLFNVLSGDMSLVGPRPERPYFVEKLAFQVPNYCQRLQVRPGITGWAQVNYKYDTTIEDVQRKLEFDLFYINNMSSFLDLKIIFLTTVRLLTAVI